MTLGKERRKIAFPRLVGLRLGAEAAAQLGILGQTFGDSIRVSPLSREIQMGNSLASVTLDRGLYLVTGITIAIAGLLAPLWRVSLSHAMRLYAGLFILAATTFLLLALVALRMRWPLLTGSACLIRRVPYLKNWAEQRNTDTCASLCCSNRASVNPPGPPPMMAMVVFPLMALMHIFRV